MHKARRRFLGVMLTLAAGFSLTACVSFAPDPVDCSNTSKASDVPPVNQVSIILAPTDNFTNFESLLNSLKPQIRDLLSNQPGEVNVIVADGDPQNVLRMSSDASGENGKVKNKHMVDRLLNGFYCVVPVKGHPVTSPYETVSESNMLKAFSLAAVPFANQQASAKKIFVIGNGIHTAGPLSFLETGIPAEAVVAQRVAKLRDDRALPDLNGATVTWTGLGQVTGAQPSFNEQSLRGLKAFWASVVEASKGVLGKVEGEGQGGKPADGSIHVSVVQGQPDACVSTSLTEKDGFSFAPGTSNFLDLQAARVGAQRIADELAAKNKCKGAITVTGYVASAVNKDIYVFGNQADATLSLSRAEAFKALLQQAGVKVPVIAVGGGKGSEIDWDSTGKYVESQGQLNRKVTITQQ